MSHVLAFLRDLTDLQVGVSDLVDILTVAVLIYALLALLRGTRAMQMLWGILIIWGVALVAPFFGLRTLSLVLNTLLSYVPIAIIVLYQQEIRRGLAALGSTAWFRIDVGSGEGQVMLNELALAVQALASKLIGAIIAVERRDSLAAWADTGIPLRARFSYDLLLNIFVPGTPLHDGAVILRGDELLAASCFLPLTTSHELSTELGTRHRAALGLSEETGTISLAVEGQLLRPLDETTLRNALAEHLLQLHPIDQEERR